MISQERSDFIEGRHIFDSVATAQDVIFRNKVNKEEGYLLKHDLEKAYNSVSWKSAIEAMSIKGMGQKWIQWMLTCMCGGKLQGFFWNPGKESRCHRRPASTG